MNGLLRWQFIKAGLTTDHGDTMSEFVANYDADKVPDYALPDPLVFEDGTAVQNAAMWQKRRREQRCGRKFAFTSRQVPKPRGWIF